MEMCFLILKIEVIVVFSCRSGAFNNDCTVFVFETLSFWPNIIGISSSCLTCNEQKI